jgi:hypothetical protein
VVVLVLLSFGLAAFECASLFPTLPPESWLCVDVIAIAVENESCFGPYLSTHHGNFTQCSPTSLVLT